MQQISTAVVDAITDSLKATAKFLPSLIAAIVIFVIGVIVATILKRALISLLEAINFESWLSNTGITEALKKADKNLSVSKLLGELLRWFTILIFLLPAVDQLGLGAVNDVLRSLLLYIPNVVVAVIIVAVGAVAAKLARDFVTATATGVGTQFSTVVGRVAQVAIIVFAVLAALTQLGVAPDLIKILFTGFVAMVAIAGGLAFGLGGKDVAAGILESIRQSLEERR
ncbi:MAG: hypothetical protein A3F35_02490 [Candidatus Woykebacteria bacterium RIFCSPHIGHO2_12_FULL_45_10]|uniref:Small-conductance mechanosensitive ion channel n=1 Tax=Candidatus Woykebacteria bacterium RIFCSPHIGHO2_12_FULL_45_10 TaxID=1802603 RepID=A0A1G1WR74_9BACT|nr:MAG: hypothetical protein A3F35_02490 [Candidatus Woykebacteria bacterium RIFCSPHIGHO2_12_FULL_45_10]